MITILLISHGPLAGALITSARMIAGNKENVCAVELGEGEDVASFSMRFENALCAALGQGEAIVLSDMVLGTPFNVAVSMMEKYSFCHYTATNLPFLVSLLASSAKSASAEEACATAMEERFLQATDVKQLIGGVRF